MGGRRAGASLRGVQASGADGSFKGDAPPVDAAGSGGALNFSPAAPDTGSRMGEPVVLVVGAGLSGLTYASELLRRPGSPRVVVLEASNRTHPPLPPRLLSQQGPRTLPVHVAGSATLSSGHFWQLRSWEHASMGREKLTGGGLGRSWRETPNSGRQSHKLCRFGGPMDRPQEAATSHLAGR